MLASEVSLYATIMELGVRVRDRSVGWRSGKVLGVR